MKVLLLDETASLYLKNLLSWTGDMSEAFDFKDLTSAIEFCLERRWPEMNVSFEPAASHSSGE